MGRKRKKQDFGVFQEAKIYFQVSPFDPDLPTYIWGEVVKRKYIKDGKIIITERHNKLHNGEAYKIGQEKIIYQQA